MAVTVGEAKVVAGIPIWVSGTSGAAVEGSLWEGIESGLDKRVNSNGPEMWAGLTCKFL